MGGTAPANQPRLSFTGSEDGEAETETCRAAKPLWRTTTRTLRPVRAQLTEPPDADPHVRWCGRGERATAPPMPIANGGSSYLSFANKATKDCLPTTETGAGKSTSMSLQSGLGGREYRKRELGFIRAFPLDKTRTRSEPEFRI